MNDYRYEDLTVGQNEGFEAVVTDQMMDMFALVSGDVNPLHCSEDYAKAQGYPGRVVYGMLTASLYSTLAGVYLPGKRCLLYSVDSRFRKPVFVGDILTVNGRIAEKNDTFHMIVVKAEIVNQSGEKVSKATLEIGVSK